MKIIMLAPNRKWKYNWGTWLFRNELGKHHEVYYYGDRYHGHTQRGQMLKSYVAIKAFLGCGKPDIVVTNGVDNCGEIRGLDQVKVPKVALLCDYFPRNYKKQDDFLKRNKFQLALLPYKHAVRRLRKREIVKEVRWFPHGVDTEIYEKKEVKKPIDVLAVFSYNDFEYPNRAKVRRVIDALQVTSFTKKVVRHEYIQKINESKMAVASMDKYGSFNLRMTEIPACGTLLISDECECLKELGFKNRENIVLYETINHLRKRVDYYLKHEKERERIALNGMKLVREHHSNRERVKQFTKIVQSTL